jgi:hypothetical protein
LHHKVGNFGLVRNKKIGSTSDLLISLTIPARGYLPRARAVSTLLLDVGRFDLSVVEGDEFLGKGTTQGRSVGADDTVAQFIFHVLYRVAACPVKLKNNLFDVRPVSARQLELGRGFIDILGNGEIAEVCPSRGGATRRADNRGRLIYFKSIRKNFYSVLVAGIHTFACNVADFQVRVCRHAPSLQPVVLYPIICGRSAGVNRSDGCFRVTEGA